MKTKKFASVLCACAMLLSALPFASAAEPVSEYAGQTISVQVSEATETGMDSRVIQVAIPAGATKAEEDAIVYAAALGRDMAAPLSAKSSVSFPLSTMKNFSLSQTPTRVGGGNLMPDGSTEYEKIIVDITLSNQNSGERKLYFQVRDVRTPDMATAWQPETVKPGIAKTITIFTGGLPSVVSKGISVYAKTEPGYYVEVSACTVMAVAN